LNCGPIPSLPNLSRNLCRITTWLAIFFWFNINSHNLLKNFAYSPSTAKTPKYIENGINNLPSILFDGMDD
jgi:hypothetical protein